MSRSLPAAPTEREAFAEALENHPLLVNTVKVRDLDIRFHVINRRLLQISNDLENIEPDLLDWIDTLEAGTVLYDLGASNGPFAIYAALRGMRVVAFEPEAQNFAVLEMNHYLNRECIEYPIVSMNMALGDTAGLGKIYCRDYVAGTHVKILDAPLKVIERDTFVPEHVQYVPRDTLDHAIERYRLPKPACLKIDVDGSEMPLLRGARKTLGDPSLSQVFIEIAFPQTRGRGVVNFIEQEGFTLATRTQVEHYEGLDNCLFRR